MSLGRLSYLGGEIVQSSNHHEVTAGGCIGFDKLQAGKHNTFPFTGCFMIGLQLVQNAERIINALAWGAT